MSSNKKIIARMFGGIGNQLFIYAAARRLALMNNAELVLDNISGFTYDKVYQRKYQLDHFNIPCRKANSSERMEPFSRVRRYIKRRLNQLLPFEYRHYIKQNCINFDYRLLQVKFRDTLYLEGYWQSEAYFKDIEEIIRRELVIKPPIDTLNLAMVENIRSHTAVAVHVRFFDESMTTTINNAPPDYYTRAIQEMENRVSKAHYYLFSDNPESARNHISLPDDRITIISHNQGDAHAHSDLWLMTNCRHFIIANSTFSWWGAWLSAYPDKKIIAPNFVLSNPLCITTWNLPGLLPSSWIKL
jgi:hypothetical protein